MKFELEKSPEDNVIRSKFYLVVLGHLVITKCSLPYTVIFII
jgi:hypothetical protein